MKLNLGCGPVKMQGFFNVDKRKSANPDQVVDLEQLPWPWETSSVEEILMSHVLEHLGRDHEVFLGIIKELYRVTVDGGHIWIKVPHHRHETFFGDPTHVRAITPMLMTLFDKKQSKEWLDRTVVDQPIDVDLEIISVDAALTPFWKEKVDTGKITQDQLDHAEKTFNNVVSELTFHLIAHKL